MTNQTIEALHNDFSIENKLSIIEGVESNDSFPFINIKNEHASAIISLYGAHVLSYKPQSSPTGDDLLYVSEAAVFKHDKAIRGGIPICWPWFARDFDNPERPMHGFVRNQMWTLEETSSETNGNTVVILSISDNEKSRAFLPNSFKLSIKITVGKSLKVELTTENTSDESFEITQALHTYFSVADNEKAHIEGFDKMDYMDAVIEGRPVFNQEGDIRLEERTDRIYLGSPEEIKLVDEARQQNVLITSNNSNTSVVWNPGIDLSKSMADLKDDSYTKFVCIETTNAASDMIEIKPNSSFCLTAEYQLSV